LAPLRHLGILNPDPVPRLAIADQPDDDSRVNGPAASGAGGTDISPARCALLALHPGSGSPRKNWTESKWAALLEGLVADTNVDFLLVGGEAESDTYRRLSGLIPAQREVPAFNLPLAHLARLLSHCIGFVGHDSGISHLAAAAGLPGLVLWGPTSAAVWCPRSPDMTILYDPAGLEHLTVARVRSALVSRFPKWIP
jgi:ADP-heptose:LPS heptosyltransferase